MVGLAAMPSPSLIATPVVPTSNVLFVTVVPLVFTIIPLPALSNEADAPFRAIDSVLCAPLSVMLIPLVAVSALLLLRVGSWFTVRNVCVCAGDAAIAPAVVCTVKPFCTTGTNSVPSIGPAVGNWVIVTLDI